MKRVVVTGLGAVTPIGNNISAYSTGLQSGLSGSAIITHFDPTNFKTQFACEVKEFNVEKHLDRKEARKLDPFSQFAMVATEEAMIDSGIDMEKEDPFRAGVVWGSGVGGLLSLETEISAFATGNGIPRYSPFMIVKMIANIASGHIAIKYGLQGINYATVSACASSSHALLNAYDYIRLGKADFIITGGSEACVTQTAVGGFNAMKALSTRNDDPVTASRPFDKDRDGFVLGEGAGAIILEEYEHAVKRGAKIYAEIAGGGMTDDAYHITAPDPDGGGVKRVMRMALSEAKMNPEDVDYVNVHGTSTPLGDIAEIKSIIEVFGDHAFDMNISSTKSMTGHLLGAAGAIESIAGILAIHEGFIPPTINHFTHDPEIDSRLNLTLNQTQRRKVNVVMNNTFGFGGHNSTILIKSFN